MRFGRWNKVPSSNAAVLFLFIGIALTALLVAFVMQRSQPGRSSIQERSAIRTGPTAALPAGAVAGDEAVVEFIATTVPTYAVAYLSEGAAQLALIEAGAAGEHMVRQVVPLTPSVNRYVELPDLTLMVVAPEEPALLLVAGAVGPTKDAILVMVREGRMLRPVNMRLKDGTVAPAEFWSGTSGVRRAAVSFSDVDGDGQQEIVVRIVRHDRPTEESAAPQVEIEVYAWRLGMFMYDQELSWAMAMSDDLFPAPTAEEVDAEDTGP
ncbi:hypothetical protein AMJ57_02520 [Parcubacteria bacterium SG8_24]|nr:MAG: hypothetical protein AMJ57_02520 [Parcubacteria bacterium SG8_24]